MKTVSPKTRRRLEIQGFVDLDDKTIAEVGPWLRMAFAFCATLAGLATQYAAIHRQLNGFYNKWTPEGVAADIPAAHADLVARLATVGIVYGDSQGSRGRNDQVNGLWIGEILDMVNTLCMFLKDATGFLPKKFWSKLKTMTTIMGEDD